MRSRNLEPKTNCLTAAIGLLVMAMLTGPAWPASLEWVKAPAGFSGPVPQSDARIGLRCMSNDCSTVIGSMMHDDFGYGHGFVWSEEGGFIDLGGYDFPLCVSADGKTVVVRSWSEDSGGYYQVWTAESGFRSLGLTEGQLRLVDVSGDCTVLVGVTRTEPESPVRWTEETGVVDLGLLPGYEGGEASAVSADGSIVFGGCSNDTGKDRLFRWTEATGMVDLGELPDSRYTDIGMIGASDDGSTVVGVAGRADYGYYWRWTEANGFEVIATEIEGFEALLLSGDGLLLAGRVWLDPDTLANKLVIWDEEHGIRYLSTMLVESGVPEEEADFFDGAFPTGLSADGQTVVGPGFYDDHPDSFWLVRGPFDPPPSEGEVHVEPQFVLFQDQAVDDGPSAPHTITVGNTGTGDLSSISVALTGTNPGHFAIASDTGQGTLTPGQERLVDAVFDPYSVGDKTAYLSIESDDPTNPMVEVTLTGHAYLAPEIEVTPTSWTWPYQSIPDAPALPGAVVITNTGGGSLEISDIALKLPNPFQFLIMSDTGETSLGASQSRVVEVAFNPTGPGEKTSSLRITSNDPDEPTVDVALSGTGFYPDIGYISPVWVDADYQGIEQGTEAEPCNTMGEAANLVLTSGTVMLKPGGCNECVRITKAMRLEAASAAAMIGAPSVSDDSGG